MKVREFGCAIRQQRVAASALLVAALACQSESKDPNASQDPASVASDPSSPNAENNPGMHPTGSPMGEPAMGPDEPAKQPAIAEPSLDDAQMPMTEDSDESMETPPSASDSPTSEPNPEQAEEQVPDPGAGGSGSDPEAAETPPDAGSGDGEGSGAGGSGADGKSPAATGCDDSFILCEDFESTDVGDIPAGWERRGDEVWVDEDEAFAGSHSLKLGPIDSWERRISHDASSFPSAHWGRIYYKVQLPVPDAFVHSTLLAFAGDGPRNGASEFRFIDTVKQAVDTPDVGSRHNFLFNVQIDNAGEFGRETSYDWEFDGQWHCAEYHVDASNQSYAFFLDGNEELSFEDGAGNFDDSDLPDSFNQVRVGWNNYQSAPPGFTAWMDEIAFAVQRIGCDL